MASLSWIDYLMTYEGYMHYGEKLKEQCIEKLLHDYIDEIEDLAEYKYTSEDLRYEVIAMVKVDLDYFRKNEKYEICTILRDLRNALQV